MCGLLESSGMRLENRSVWNFNLFLFNSSELELYLVVCTAWLCVSEEVVDVDELTLEGSTLLDLACQSMFKA